MSSLFARSTIGLSVLAVAVVAGAASSGVAEGAETNGQAAAPESEASLTAEADLRNAQLRAEVRQSECEGEVAAAKLNVELAELRLQEYTDDKHGKFVMALAVAKHEVDVAAKEFSIAKAQLTRLKEKQVADRNELMQAELDFLKASGAVASAEARLKHLQTYGRKLNQLHLEAAVAKSRNELIAANRQLERARDLGEQLSRAHERSSASTQDFDSATAGRRHLLDRLQGEWVIDSVNEDGVKHSVEYDFLIQGSHVSLRTKEDRRQFGEFDLQFEAASTPQAVTVIHYSTTIERRLNFSTNAICPVDATARSRATERPGLASSSYVRGAPNRAAPFRSTSMTDVVPLFNSPASRGYHRQGGVSAP